MEVNEPQKLNLVNLCNGAVLEVFEHDLDKVLQNISDRNTNWKAKREITLTISLLPLAEDRVAISVNFQSKAKLAPVEQVKSTAFLGRQNGVVVAIAHDPRQTRLFDVPSSNRPPNFQAQGEEAAEKMRALGASGGSQG